AAFFAKPHVLIIVVAYAAALVLCLAAEARARSLRTRSILARCGPFAGLALALPIRAAIRAVKGPMPLARLYLGGYAQVRRPAPVPAPRIATVALGLVAMLPLSVGIAGMASLLVPAKRRLSLLAAALGLALAAVMAVEIARNTLTSDSEPFLYER